MKGKNPTLRQKKVITDAGWNPQNWLVTKNLPNELHIKHRETGTRKVIPA